MAGMAADEHERAAIDPVLGALRDADVDVDGRRAVLREPADALAHEVESEPILSGRGRVETESKRRGLSWPKRARHMQAFEVEIDQVTVAPEQMDAQQHRTEGRLERQPDIRARVPNGRFALEPT